MDQKTCISILQKTNGQYKVSLNLISNQES
jgi:hypothetical protein